MSDTRKLFEIYGQEKALYFLDQAIHLAKINPQIDWVKLQKAFGIGYEPACIIHDWLGDGYLTEPRVTNHWKRRVKAYIMNNQSPTLVGIVEKLKIGYRTSSLILVELQKKGLVDIKIDMSFIRLCPKATRAQLIQQLKVYGKKYRGRCEPELLMRLMYVDSDTAKWLSEYGFRKLGFKRKYRERIK